MSRLFDTTKAVKAFVRLAGVKGVGRKAARSALDLNTYQWLQVTKAARDAGLVELVGWGRTALYVRR